MATVLVLDDDARVGNLMAQVLQGLGHHCIVCETPAEAEATLINLKASGLKENELLVIVDGDLGDRDFGWSGMSGSFVKDHLQGKVRYGRMSFDPGELPQDDTEKRFALTKPLNFRQVVKEVSAALQ
jgi:hypothetical protein